MNSVRIDPSATTAVILVAEDHADSREALRALLEASGFEVHVAANGQEAIDRAHAVQPDLVLMDLMMPEVDGFTATRTLRSFGKFSAVPILALTAMEGSRELALAAGCNDFMLKPIDVRAFLLKIGQWLSASPAEDHGAQHSS